jgi:O-antigen/teichoic acid export membrane protein
MVQSTVTAAAGVGAVGIGYTATKFVAEYRASAPARAAAILRLGAVASATMGLVAAVLLAGLSPVIARAALRTPDLAASIALGAVAVAVMIGNNFRVGALAGLEAYPSLARSAVVYVVVLAVACAVGARQAGVPGAVGGFAVGAVVYGITLALVLRAEVRRQGMPASAGVSRDEARLLWSFALPAALSALSTLPALWLVNLAVARRPGGYPDVALFAAALNIKAMVLYLPILVNGVSMSLINHALGRGEAARYRTVFWLNLGLSCAAVLLAAGAIAPWGEGVMRVYGAEFRAGGPVLAILMLAAVPEALSIALYQIVQSRSRMWLSLFALALPRDVLTAVAAFALVPGHGIGGAAWAIVLGQALGLCASMLVVRRLGLNLPVRGADPTALV